MLIAPTVAVVTALVVPTINALATIESMEMLLGLSPIAPAAPALRKFLKHNFSNSLIFYPTVYLFF